MNKRIVTLTALVVAGAGLCLGGCEKKPEPAKAMQKAGEAAKTGVTKAGEAVKDGAAKAGEAAKEATGSK
ncbi:MAG: hypothetical protein LW650_07195 [Planctomycetaceae bacterium]|jgi:hypothetical protein|nr:hypothetical protein [Phycisphaerales bacterium]MCE2653278.1 hypothetical protein [Planctomycetaceae bacterium]